MTDIHGAKTSEIEFQIMAETYKAIFEHIAVGIAKISFSDNIVETNNKLAQLLGLSKEQLSEYTLLELTHPDDQYIDSANAQQLKDGKIDNYTVEKRLIMPETNQYKWILLTIARYQSTLNNSFQRLVMFQDISDRKNTEQLLEDSNQALEHFAYAASHDLQEPLRKISSFAQRLDQRLSEKNLDEASKYELSRITDAAGRMSRMITSLLNLARINSQTLELQHCSLSQVLDEVKDVLSLKIAESHASIILQSDLKFMADFQLMCHLFQNLITNSIHYGQEGRSPVISVQCVINMENCAQIYLEDNGSGIDMEHAEDIFAPFKRLSSKYNQGQGMGLSICHQIMKAHGGKIYIEKSVIHEGTTFSIILPQSLVL